MTSWIHSVPDAGTDVASHTTIGHGSPATLTRGRGTFGPTSLVVVPRILEWILAVAEDASGSCWRHTVFLWGHRYGHRPLAGDLDPRGPQPLGHAAPRLCRRPRVSTPPAPVRRCTAPGHRRRVGSGPTRRPPLSGAGLDVLEGCGSTATPARITVNRPHVALTGFRGCRNDPGRTIEALRDGSLHTGDLARLGSRGNPFITGRSKDLIADVGPPIDDVYPTGRPQPDTTPTSTSTHTRAQTVGMLDRRLPHPAHRSCWRPR